MNHDEAILLLEAELLTLRGESYEALVRLIGKGPTVRQRRGQAAMTYQIEIDVVWDGPKGGNVRVIGSIDDGGWRAWVPVTRSFMKRPPERTVDE